MDDYLSRSLNRTSSLNRITSQIRRFWIFPGLLLNSMHFSLAFLRV